MTYRDLLDALTRLASDPRIHPNTPVDVGFEAETFEFTTGGNDHITSRHADAEPLIAIGMDGNRLVLSAHSCNHALAR